MQFVYTIQLLHIKFEFEFECEKMESDKNQVEKLLICQLMQSLFFDRKYTQ